jgi:hypothetical protein
MGNLLRLLRMAATALRTVPGLVALILATVVGHSPWVSAAEVSSLIKVCGNQPAGCAFSPLLKDTDAGSPRSVSDGPSLVNGVAQRRASPRTTTIVRMQATLRSVESKPALKTTPQGIPECCYFSSLDAGVVGLNSQLPGRGNLIINVKRIRSSVCPSRLLVGGSRCDGTSAFAYDPSPTSTTAAQFVATNTASGVWNDLDSLSASGSRVEGSNGLTRAGRKLEQHGGQGNLPKVSGNVAAKNAQGQALLEEILKAPGTRIVANAQGKFVGGQTFIDSAGRGAVFDSNGVFVYFGVFK